MSHAAQAYFMDPQAQSSSPAHGGELFAVDGRSLALERSHLSVQAGAGIARVVLEQRFHNPHDRPLQVTYTLPLPVDGAVSGFSFRIGETLVVGEVDRKQAAKQRFERAIASGKTAALLDQERPNLFSQRVGNIPPRQDVVCEVTIDQRLDWLPEGAWEWRFPTVVGARYLGAAGRVQDADQVAVAVADAPLPERLTLALDIDDALADGAAPDSPSHSLRTTARDRGVDVCFRNDRPVRLDRDVVVRWQVATPEVGVALELARPSGDAQMDKAYGLLTIVPPRADNDATPLARDLIFLIDTSGSMGGRPLDQAKRVVCAMIDTLSDRDRLELIEFGSRPKRWRNEPVAATRDGRREAKKWVRKRRSSGATEMHRAVLEALNPLRGSCQRQVVLITDGFIGFERQIVDEIADRLPENCRLHTIGVGSAPNRALTRPAARAGAGVEVIIGIDEDAEAVSARLLARTTAPLVTDVRVEGASIIDVRPRRLPDLFAQSPVLVSVAMNPDGGPIRVLGTTADGAYEQTIHAPALTLGQGDQAVAALYARERVEDLETAFGSRHNQRHTEKEIERLGVDFQISTRLTSWVAVTEKATVDPDDGSFAQNVPQETPYGTNIDGFGLRRSGQAPAGGGLPRSEVNGFAMETEEQPALEQATTPKMRRTRTSAVDKSPMPVAPAPGAVDKSPMPVAPAPARPATPAKAQAPVPASGAFAPGDDAGDEVEGASPETPSFESLAEFDDGDIRDSFTDLQQSFRPATDDSLFAPHDGSDDAPFASDDAPLASDDGIGEVRKRERPSQMQASPSQAPPAMISVRPSASTPPQTKKRNNPALVLALLALVIAIVLGLWFLLG